MDDPLLVRVLYSPANLDEQIQPFSGSKVILLAVVGDFYATN